MIPGLHWPAWKAPPSSVVIGGRRYPCEDAPRCAAELQVHLTYQASIPGHIRSTIHGFLGRHGLGWTSFLLILLGAVTIGAAAAIVVKQTRLARLRRMYPYLYR